MIARIVWFWWWLSAWLNLEWPFKCTMATATRHCQQQQQHQRDRVRLITPFILLETRSSALLTAKIVCYVDDVVSSAALLCVYWIWECELRRRALWRSDYWSVCYSHARRLFLSRSSQFYRQQPPSLRAAAAAVTVVKAVGGSGFLQVHSSSSSKSKRVRSSRLEILPSCCCCCSMSEWLSERFEPQIGTPCWLRASDDISLLLLPSNSFPIDGNKRISLSLSLLPPPLFPSHSLLPFDIGIASLLLLLQTRNAVLLVHTRIQKRSNSSHTTSWSSSSSLCVVRGSIGVAPSLISSVT